MASSVTVSDLVTQIRQLTDTESMDATNGFIDDAEIIDKINTYYKELYEILVNKRINFAESTQGYTGDGTGVHALPADFMAVLGVELQISTDHYVDLPEIDFSQRNRFSRQSGQPHAFRAVGTNLVTYPPASSAYTFTLYYIPTPGLLDEGTDTFDGVNGYEAWIKYSVAIELAMKEESSIQVVEFSNERERINKRIDWAADQRIKGPWRVIDERNRDYLTDPASADLLWKLS